MIVLDGPDHRVIAANAACTLLTRTGSMRGCVVWEVFSALGELRAPLEDVWASGRPHHVRVGPVAVADGEGRRRTVRFDARILPRRGREGAVVGATCVLTEAARPDDHPTPWLEPSALQSIEALQTALLPRTVPVLPTTNLAARYLVAVEDHAAGGDWFDAFAVADGHVALIVGDVVGHGVSASAAMGQLRAVAKENLLDTGSVRATLTRLEALALREDAMRAATVCIAVLDPATGAVRYATAGHPPPLIVTSDGTTRYVAPSSMGPLGTGSPVHIRSEILPAGAALVLFSDGLVERTDRSLDEGLNALARIAGDAMQDASRRRSYDSAVEQICQRSAELLAHDGFDDDVTLLAAQRRKNPVTSWDMELPAVPPSVEEMRTALCRWLQAADVSTADQDVVVLAATELVTNAVEHAYAPDAPGVVHVSTALDAGGTLVLRVSDAGVWQAMQDPPPATSGRGLWLVSTFADGMVIERKGTQAAGREGQGSVVVAHVRLTQTAMLGAQPARRRRAPSRFFTMRLAEGPPRVLHVEGAVDIETAPELRDRLDIAGRGGLLPLVVDVGAATVLASAGVRVLFEASDAHRRQGTPFMICAVAGTPPAQVLDVVGLPYRLRPSWP